VPAVGRENAREHPHRGGLAGAIGADQAEDFALGDVEIELIDGDDLAERAAQTLGVDGGEDTEE
jgi:hypothetical protein